MKPIIYSILFCILGLASVQAQDVKQNYILTRTMLDKDGSRFIETVQYYDGLGRPSQTVQKGTTPSGNNLITLQEYDALGRESNAWLPVVSAANFLPASDFKTQAANYYGNGERPYGTNGYESSPLKRILKVYGPGAAWSDHPATTDYLINTATGELSCKNYTVSESGTLVDKGNYASGQLYILKSADEDNRITYVFTDMLGRQLLSRLMSNNEYHDTYFVYDDLGNQRLILTEYTFTGNPSRITHIHTAYLSTTQTELSTYSYDHYDRISKVTHKLNSYPEVTLHENVYDDLGRLQSKRFHGNDALQNHYTYNTRNWLTSISGNQFRQELHYTDIHA